MDNVCEICGDIGFPKFMRICCNCKISREHTYCRRPIGERPEVWLCERCESTSVQKKIPEVPKWTMNPKPSRTRLLSTQEAIMLSSDANRLASSSRRVVKNMSSASRGLGFDLPTTMLNPKPPTCIPSLNMGRNSDLRRQEPSSLACAREIFSSANQQEVALTSRVLKGKNVAPVPRWEPNSGKEIQSHSRKDKMVKKEAPCLSPPLVNLPPKMSSRKNMACADASADIDRRKSGAANRELVNVPPEEKEVQGPARGSCWNTGLSDPVVPKPLIPTPAHQKVVSFRGYFRVLGTGILKDLIVAIEAHTSDKVLCKLLEFSKKLPQVLSFEQLLRPEVWNGLFQDHCPGKVDIGLYLFSDSSKRSENYFRLVEFMEACDLALITRFNDVELLVFTSNCLSADSQKWGDKHFLWGLFRRAKKIAGMSPMNNRAQVTEKERTSVMAGRS